MLVKNLKAGCCIDEVVQFQRVLKNYQIVIYEINSKIPIYTDPAYTGKTALNIMFNQDHFMGMRSVQACFGSKYICPHCYTHTSTRAKHYCKYSCSQCMSSPRCLNGLNLQDLIFCKVCSRTFFGDDCFNRHLALKHNAKKTTCEMIKNCPKCYCHLTDKHVSGKRACFTCQKLVDKHNYQCYMPMYQTKRTEHDNVLCIFFDLETH